MDSTWVPRLRFCTTLRMKIHRCLRIFCVPHKKLDKFRGVLAVEAEGDRSIISLGRTTSYMVNAQDMYAEFHFVPWDVDRPADDGHLWLVDDEGYVISGRVMAIPLCGLRINDRLHMHYSVSFSDMSNDWVKQGEIEP